MELNNIFTDDDAVSPVIGVILMVAITVILAAVIGTFVLGLGDQVQNNAPQASFSFDYQDFGGSAGTVVATHDGGATFNAENTGRLYLSAGGAETTFTAVTNGGASAGDSVSETGVNTGTDVSVIWESPSGENTATLASGTTPS